MTVKQFAEKYGITERQAYNCTYGIKPIEKRIGQNGKNQYSEDELRENLLAMIYEKKLKAQKIIWQCDEFRKKVGSIVRSERKGT